MRLEAAQQFASGVSNTGVAKDLLVSVRSVQRWRQPGAPAGVEGLRSAGSVAVSKLSRALFVLLE
ncbi:hypothetical protein [Streptomyces sp. NPDC126514]|uniref:hypothetical protein n=1 Tax=Streptomyces sp. NPDC126514 TaxID=3155210 RepID=UPI00332D585E